MLQILAYQPLLHLTRHTNLVTDADWNQVQRSDVHNTKASTTDHHQLMVEYAADSSLPTTTSSD